MICGRWRTSGLGGYVRVEHDRNIHGILNCQAGDRFFLAAYLDPGQIGLVRVDACCIERGLRDNKLDTQCLAVTFQPAGRVDGIAKGGNPVSGLLVGTGADAADNCPAETCAGGTWAADSCSAGICMTGTSALWRRRDGRG